MPKLWKGVTNETMFNGKPLGDRMSRLSYNSFQNTLIVRYIVCHGIIPKTAQSGGSPAELFAAMGAVGPLHAKYTHHKILNAVERRATQFWKDNDYMPSIVGTTKLGRGAVVEEWRYPPFMQKWLDDDWDGNQNVPDENDSNDDENDAIAINGDGQQEDPVARGGGQITPLPTPSRSPPRQDTPPSQDPFRAPPPPLPVVPQHLPSTPAVNSARFLAEEMDIDLPSTPIRRTQSPFVPPWNPPRATPSTPASPWHQVHPPPPPSFVLPHRVQHATLASPARPEQQRASLGPPPAARPEQQRASLGPPPAARPEQQRASLGPPPAVRPEQQRASLGPPPAARPEQQRISLGPPPAARPEQQRASLGPPPAVRPQQQRASLGPPPAVRPQQQRASLEPPPPARQLSAPRPAAPETPIQRSTNSVYYSRFRQLLVARGALHGLFLRHFRGEPLLDGIQRAAIRIREMTDELIEMQRMAVEEYGRASLAARTAVLNRELDEPVRQVILRLDVWGRELEGSALSLIV